MGSGELSSAELHKTARHTYTDAELSLSRSRVHVCLQALLVPVFEFERVPGP